MSDLISRTAKLLPKTKRVKPVPGYATSYHYEAEGPEGEALGNLYVVIEVLSPAKQAEAVSDLVIETVGHTYYNTELPQATTALERFEAAIKATNVALADHTNAGNASWVGRMSAVIAILVGDELHITGTGSAEAYLYRANVTSHVTTDLGKKGQQRPINTFANIASGQVQAHDRLLMATPALFHQVERAQLKTLINDNTASGTIKKLSELVSKSEDADRVAAIVVELTTADALALQVRSDEPDAIEIGQGDKPLEVAKSLAVPAALTFVNTSKAVTTKAAEHARSRLLPQIRQTALKAVDWIRTRLQSTRGRQQLGIMTIIIVAALVGLGFWHNATLSSASQLKTYDSIYQTYTKAQTLVAEGNKTEARTLLTQANNQLTDLNKLVNHSNFNAKLAHRAHPEADPASIPKLQAEIAALTDQIDGIVKLPTTLLTSFAGIKNAQPDQIELVGNKLVMVDGSNGSSIYTYNLTTKTLATAITAPTGVGQVVATTPSSDGSGVYLLTAEPAVWLFKPLDNSLTRQTISFGNWPAGRSIASYAGNLYILATDSSQLYKLVPTAGGFNTPTNYFSDNTVVKSTTSIEIDGSIYLMGGSNGLRRFVSGKLDQGLSSIPTELQNPDELLSISSTNRLLSLDASSSRFGLFSTPATAITLDKQLVLQDAGKLYGATTDNNSTFIYAIIKGKLVSAALPQ